MQDLFKHDEVCHKKRGALNFGSDGDDRTAT